MLAVLIEYQIQGLRTYEYKHSKYMTSPIFNSIFGPLYVLLEWLLFIYNQQAEV